MHEADSLLRSLQLMLACVPDMTRNLWGGSPHTRCSRSRRLGEEGGKRPGGSLRQGRVGRRRKIGEVLRKPNAKVQGDEQEPDMRCGTLGASGARDREALHRQSGRAL